MVIQCAGSLNSIAPSTGMPLPSPLFFFFPLILPLASHPQTPPLPELRRGGSGRRRDSLNEMGHAMQASMPLPPISRGQGRRDAEPDAEPAAQHNGGGPLSAAASPRASHAVPFELHDAPQDTGAAADARGAEAPAHAPVRTSSPPLPTAQHRPARPRSPSTPPPPRAASPPPASAAEARLARSHAAPGAPSMADLDEMPVGGGNGKKAMGGQAQGAPGEPALATLTPAQHNALAAALAAFGDDCVRRLVSKSWQLKDAALTTILKAVASGMPGVSPTTVCGALAQVLRQLDGIKLKKVVARRLELTSAIIRAVLPALSSASAGGTAAAEVVGEVVTVLLPSCGESVAATRQQAQNMMLTLLTGPAAAAAREAGAVESCLAPQPKAAPPRQALGMLELAGRLVREHGLSDAGAPGAPATLSQVMALASPLLRNAKVDIRNAAMETVAQCYRRAGQKAIQLASIDPATEGALAKALDAACASAGSSGGGDGGGGGGLAAGRGRPAAGASTTTLRGAGATKTRGRGRGRAKKG